MKPSRRPWFSISIAAAVILAAVLPAAAFTYTYPLSSTDIRDAYFIGRRNDESSAAFFVKYTRHFDPPASGPYISDVGIDTPFTQIAMHAARTPNYDAPTAVQEFQDRPMKFYAHVIIALTATYSLTQCPLGHASTCNTLRKRSNPLPLLCPSIRPTVSTWKRRSTWPRYASLASEASFGVVNSSSQERTRPASCGFSAPRKLIREMPLRCDRYGPALATGFRGGLRPAYRGEHQWMHFACGSRL
jgi:hypothetical protein